MHQSKLNIRAEQSSCVMAEIYVQATGTCIWLGVGEPEMEHLLKLMLN
jgi:hypothetical protein